MKKAILFILLIGSVLLVACGNTTESNETEGAEQQEVEEKETNKANDSNVKEEEQKETSEAEETSPEELGGVKEDSEADNGSEQMTDMSEVATEPVPEVNKNEKNDTNKDKAEQKETKDKKGDDPEKPDVQEKLMDLGYEILYAQQNKDYSFLGSILANGATMDKATDTFYFENITSPHEMEFIQSKQAEIEYRFFHPESDNKIIVGFAIVDYEKESSFTVDFVFVKENGEWKMNDMDINA